MRKRLQVFARITVSVVLLGYLCSLIDLQVVLSHLQNINGALITLAYALLLTQIMLSAFKWKLILKADRVCSPYLFLLRTYFIGGFLSLFLPTSMGGDVYRVVAVKNISHSLGKSLSSVLFDRLSGLFALISIALWSYLFFPGARHALALFSVYVLSVFLLLVLSTPALARRQALRLKGASRFLHLLQSFIAYRNDIPLLVAVVGLAVVFQLTTVWLHKLYCVALGIDMPLAHLLVVIPLIYMMEMLPVSINGLGVRENAFVFFFVQLGKSEEEGLAVALLVVLLRYLIGLVGGFVLLATTWRTRAEGVTP